MNQPCYNSIALARHQHEIDRQEAKEHWIAAAVDRLMDDFAWCINANMNHGCASHADRLELAKKEAAELYQQHLSALEQARIDGMVSE